ncbi:RRQRL motif-containing zinc-binding protein [Phytohabitans kaempferiae]|uniref:RRQRL motif-containing zinc-binding protein n=1 Tax=Phytohabitans kaempferiae TaxID=1620943 RepID=A0ABV6MEH4_9ACTN
MLRNQDLDFLVDHRGFFLEFYDPDGQRFGFPTFPYHCAPDGLVTRRQLRAAGLRPAGQPVIAQILWRHRKHTRTAYLYRRDLAKPKRQATDAQLIAVSKALLARRTCPTCGQVKDYYIPRRSGECLDCNPEVNR